MVLRWAMHFVQQTDGIELGTVNGTVFGFILGRLEIDILSVTVRIVDGRELGDATLGTADDMALGLTLGTLDDNALGMSLGITDGTILGDAIGTADGASLGAADGTALGLTLCTLDGNVLGMSLGTADGNCNW